LKLTIYTCFITGLPFGERSKLNNYANYHIHVLCTSKFLTKTFGNLLVTTIFAVPF
jgi:hypothetical protein